MASPLAFVQVAALGLLVAVAVLWVLVLIAVYAWVVRPLVEWSQRSDGGWFKRIVYWPIKKAIRITDSFMREHIAALRRYVASNLKPIILLFVQLADVTTRLAGTIGDMSEQIYDALYTLRHVTVPNLITAALVPIKAQLQRHTDRLDALEDLNRRVAVVIGTGLRTLPWGVPGSYVGNFQAWWNSYSQLWDYTYNTLRPRVNELWTNRVTNLKQRLTALETQVTTIREEALPAIRQRLGRIETWLGGMATDPTTWLFGLIGAALVPALSAATVRQRIGSLFCRNTATVTQRICAMNEEELLALLGLAAAFGLLLDPKAVLRAGQEAEGIMDGVIRQMAGI